jgi:hypothetical protein
MIQALINRLMAFMTSLASDGGPSSTRWIYMRSSEIFWYGWFFIVLAAIYRYVRFADANAGWLTLIGTLAAAGFAFVQNAQTTKLAIDAKNTGSPSSVVTSPLGSEVTAGELVK